MESKVVIEYDPLKTIAVMECTEFENTEDLARFVSITTGGKPTGLYWADGVAFIYFPVHATADAIAKAIIEEKKVYWSFLGYTSMPKYMRVVETKERMMVPVVDISRSSLFQKVAKWIKER